MFDFYDTETGTTVNELRFVYVTFEAHINPQNSFDTRKQSR